MQISKLHVESAGVGETKGPTRFAADVGIEFDLSLPDLEVRVGILIHAATKGKGKSNAPALATIEVGFLYRVENLKELCDLDGSGGLVMHGGLATALASITYSTTRGILLDKFKHTAFEAFVLPVVDPARLLAAKQA